MTYSECVRWLSDRLAFHLLADKRRSRVSGTASVKIDQRVSEGFLPPANDETENEQACSEEQNTARFRYVHFENCRCSVRLNVVDSETCHRSHR